MVPSLSKNKSSLSHVYGPKSLPDRVSNLKDILADLKDSAKEKENVNRVK